MIFQSIRITKKSSFILTCQFHNIILTDVFSYTCDGKCKDYIYRVRQGKSPFCKHYPAVIGELICQENLIKEANHLYGKKLNSLLEIVEKRKKEDGVISSDDRNVENTLKNLKSDL